MLSNAVRGLRLILSWNVTMFCGNCVIRVLPGVHGERVGAHISNHHKVANLCLGHATADSKPVTLQASHIAAERWQSISSAKLSLR
jgi:hypothetical protein